MNRLLFIALFFAYVLCGTAEEQHTCIRHLTARMGLTDNRVTVLAQDHHGYIWAGTPNGLNRISGHEVYTWSDSRHPLRGIHVSGLEVDEADDCLWIFTPQGLKGCFDLERNMLIPHTPDRADSLLHRHHKGRLYMWQYGPAKRCVRTRLHNGRLSTEVFHHELVDVCTDEEGGDWLLTTRGLYLNGFEEKLPGSDSVTHIATFRNLCLALAPQGITVYNHSRRKVRRTSFPVAYRRAANCTDMAAWGDRLLIFTADRTVLYQILDDTFSSPSKGQIQNGQVIAQRGGVIHVHDGKGKLLRFGRDDTVHSLRLASAEMAADWGGTSPRVAVLNGAAEAVSTYGNGLHILHTATGKATHLRQEDARDLIADNRIHDLLVDHTGCLWTATDQGGLACLQLSVEADESRMPDGPPAARIIFVAIDGEERLVDGGEIELPYTHNNVEWHFSCMAYDRMDDIRYQYYLEGCDSTWQASTYDHEAIYRDLSPGRYTFHVKAGFDGIRWGSESIHAVVIGHPWWTQWPTVVTAVALFVAMGLLLYFCIRAFMHPQRLVSRHPQELVSPKETTATIVPANETHRVEEGENTPEPLPEPRLTAKDERFKQQLYALMEEHIEDPDFSVEAFATLVGLKRTQFYTKVKRITGLTPIELLRQAHLEHAAKLLMETDLNIDEVRERCCFTNSTTFYNYFKHQYGLTPRQYRQNPRR